MFLLPNMITNQLILRLGGFFQVPCKIYRLIKMQAVLIFLFSLHILSLHEKFMVHTPYNGHSKLALIFLTQSIPVFLNQVNKSYMRQTALLKCELSVPWNLTLNPWSLIPDLWKLRGLHSNMSVLEAVERQCI